MSFAIPLGKVNADDVRLHVFAKGNDAEFRITANTSSGKELVMDWTFVSQTILHQQRLYAGDATETVLDSTFTVGYEYFTCLLSDSMTSEDGSYHLILEMRSADNDASLSIVGVCAEKMSPAAMYAIETDRWAQYSELLTPFSGWLTLDYTQQGKGYQAVSKQFTMPSIEDYDTIKLRVKRGTGAGGPEGIMVYKISGYDFETGKNYVLKDWFVMAFRQGEQIYDLLLDAEASRALSQKNILLTIQAQPQELQPDGSAGASIGDKEGNIGYLVTGSFNVFEFALSGYKNPQQSAVFTDIVGGIYNADTVVQVKADTFIGELKLSGGTESIPSSAKQTVTVNQSNNIYVSFYAKAGNSDGITMPKTSFRLTVSLNGGEEVNLLAWHTIGGTSSRISDGNTDFGLVINDRYEWYCLSLDNYFLNSAGTLVFTMYQMNTQAQDAEELYITGFSVSPREANTPGTGGFDSAFSEAGHLLGGWIGSTDIHVGFGSWMEIFGSHDDSYPYYAIAKLLSVPELTDDASAYRFSTTVSNVGNADEMLLKMVAVDSTGNVYCLTDWTCIYCTNIDTPYAVEFDETTSEQISGKTLNVIIQFADTQNQGSNPGATDRLYLNGFALTQAEV